MEGMTTTSNVGSPLVQATRARRKKKGDVENAADARKPGDAAEDKGANFIKGAIKKPGSLHAALNVPANQRIPGSALAQAARSQNTNLKRKANFAKTLKGFGK